MIYLLHKEAETEAVKQNIIPLLDEREVELVSYPGELNFQSEEDSIFITYLDDQLLREFLPVAASKNWPIGILPHPEVKHAIKGLGIAGKLKESILEIFNSEESHKLDILCCNGELVFQSVNIGEVFILKQDTNRNSFLSELMIFLKNIRKIPSLSHKAFKLRTNEEKVINTSALGIVVVEHPFSSVVSKRTVTHSSLNDGLLNVLIIAPENIVELVWFLWRSILPNKTPMAQLPGFVGQMKVPSFNVENGEDIEYTLDGEERKAKEIKFEVQKEALVLKQASIYETTTDNSKGRKTIKIDSLPKGEKKEELTRRKLPLFPRATTEEFSDLLKVLRENAKTDATFLVMMVLSTFIATCGLFINSSPVIIGAMILAPIISPIVAFSMGMVRNDKKLLKTGIVTIFLGILFSLVFAAIVSLVVPLQVVTPEIYARLSPNLLDMGIAVASGVAAAYAHSKEEIAKSLAGVAIAVALVPPLAVAGIGIGWWNWNIFSGAFLLFLTNLSGIIMFAGLTFLLLGFAPFKRARMGLVYTLIIIGLVTVPLTLSFERIREESQIVKVLEGTTINSITLKDVEVRQGEPVIISLRMVSARPIAEEEIARTKADIEKKIGSPIVLEAVTAVRL